MTTGRPAAIACQTLLGTTRAALSLVPKTPRQIEAAATSAPSGLVGHPPLPGEARRAVAAELALEPGAELAVADQAHRGRARARAPPPAPWRRRAAGRACRRRARAVAAGGLGRTGKRSGSAPTGTTAIRARGTPKRSREPVGAGARCRRAPGRPGAGVRRSTPARSAAAARPASGPVAGERVGQRDHHVHHQRHPAGPGDAPGRAARRAGPGSRRRRRRPGAPAAPATGEAGPGAGEARAPTAASGSGAGRTAGLVAAALPHRAVVLDHVDAELAQARDSTRERG